MYQEEKTVTWRSLQLGQKITGYRLGNRSSMFDAYVKSVNPSYVTVARWKVDGEEERIDSNAMFCIEMTRKEMENKYFDSARNVLKNIQNKLHYDEIGYHEMWNAWLYLDPYELAQACRRNKITIVGHCTDIIPKTALFSGEILDVGVCAEYEDGERFWCHWKMQDIEDMFENYPELLLQVEINK